ncbi:semaphorin-4D isoform X3 [Labeo rohita]|uniref:Semaphorin-4D isoform X3 n=1 Tax=Labeo rohita TaxID=84645 RepID=A0A498M0E3_LABRO|nr:semaphorin-4D isoform X3 [Labeo rohita]
MIPPLLREQSWSVHPHQAFLLFCLALGPRDVSVEWHINGQKLETPVTEYRHVISHDAVLVSSWLREEALNKDVQYECTAVSDAGNDVSKVDLRLNSRDEADVPLRDVERWRNALTDHNTLLQQWKKAWTWFMDHIMDPSERLLHPQPPPLIFGHQMRFGHLFGQFSRTQGGASLSESAIDHDCSLPKQAMHRTKRQAGKRDAGRDCSALAAAVQEACE